MRALDEDLVRAAMAGEPAALAALLAQAQPDIRRYAQRACSHRDDVDDAVQETLLQLHRRLGTLRAAAALPAWLATTAQRECLRLWRLGYRLRDAVPLDDELLPAATRGDAALRLDLQAALDALPAHYREVLLLRDFLELRVDEMAAELDLSREAVKARLHRARAMVREYLKG